MDKEKTVLIVGAGPVGMVLASQLAKFGISTRIIEKRVGYTEGSKALSINAASLKIFDSMDLIDAFLSKGKKVYDVNVYWNSERFFHLDCRRISTTPYSYYLTLPQPETEKILADQLKLSNQTIERQVTLLALKNKSRGVDVRLLHSDGTIEDAHYNYVIGCDGSKSTVRTCLGKSFNGVDYDMHLWLFDAKLIWNNPQKETAQYFVSEEGFIIVIPLTDGLHRVVIKENQSPIENRQIKRSQQEYQQIIDRFIHDGVKIDCITWQSNAPMYNRLADSFRDNNVFLAGDAAHLFSPIGGLGMNTGIQDAYNLAWKLAGVILGRFNPQILDSYENERLAMATQLVRSTDETTQLITQSATDNSERLHDWMPLMKNRDSMRLKWPQGFSGLGQKYSDTRLTTSHHERKTRLANKGEHIPFALAADVNGGCISTYHLVSDYSPVVLIFEEIGERLNSFLSALNEFQLKTVIVSMSPIALKQNNAVNLLDKLNQFYSAFDAQEGDVLLLRPDGYIGCRSHTDQAAAFTDYLDSFLLK